MGSGEIDKLLEGLKRAPRAREPDEAPGAAAPGGGCRVSERREGGEGARVVHVTHRYESLSGAGDVVGHVEVHRREGSWWLTNLWVHPERRGKGLGGELLAEALRDNPGELFLQVAPYTDAPLSYESLARWYGAHGFERTSVPTIMRRPAEDP